MDDTQDSTEPLPPTLLGIDLEGVDVQHCSMYPLIAEIASRIDKHAGDLNALGTSARDAHDRIGILRAAVEANSQRNDEGHRELRSELTELRHKVLDAVEAQRRALDALIYRHSQDVKAWEERQHTESAKLDKIVAAVTAGAVENVKRWERTTGAILKIAGAVALLGSGGIGAVVAFEKIAAHLAGGG